MMNEGAACACGYHVYPIERDLLEPREVAVPSSFRLLAGAQFRQFRRPERLSLVGPVRYGLPFQENLSEGSILFTESFHFPLESREFQVGGLTFAQLRKSRPSGLHQMLCETELRKRLVPGIQPNMRFPSRYGQTPKAEPPSSNAPAAATTQNPFPLPAETLVVRF